ncbi:hypothetical protein PO124_26510 [Bacillus licheniformis]|nr:hypothetical protein [Bacillus licheniformis]
MKADEKEIRTFNDTGIYMPCFAGGSVYISADLDGRFIDEPEADIYNNISSIKAFLPSFHPSEWFQSYREVLSRFDLLMYIGNSLFYGLCVAAGAVIINGMAGFAFAKLQFTGKKCCLPYCWRF